MKKILIIDDNKDVLVMFEQLLLDKGYGVSTVNNGAAGIELFKRESFDLVIKDIGMPGIGCFDMIKRITNIIMIPIIIMSKDILSVDPVKVSRLGVNAIIPKTLNFGAFCNVIRSCLEDNP
ncbi:MAG: response regulator [Candidatus Scalindua sp.]